MLIQHASRFARNFSTAPQQSTFLSQAGYRYYDLMPLLMGAPLVWYFAADEGFGFVRQAPDIAGQTEVETRVRWNEGM